MYENQEAVRAKKYLGQHFLKDKNIASKIANTLSAWEGNLLEIGPGMGVLTEFLLQRTSHTKVVEVDPESIQFLKQNQIIPEADIIQGDFLKIDLGSIFDEQPFAIIGNFPYNISSQIVFKALENRHLIPFFSGMFQKEVAERIAMKPGSKAYGILSVFCQAYYEVDYLFTVPPTVFSPPPKVNSGVMRMIRKENFTLNCDEALFYKIVKMAFNTRRKMLRTSLKPMVVDPSILENPIFTKRPEQLSYVEFESITNLLT